MSGLCLLSITVALSFENVCEIYTLDGARKGLEKWLARNVIQVISRQSNFWRLQKCLKKQLKKDKKEFAVMIAELSRAKRVQRSTIGKEMC